VGAGRSVNEADRFAFTIQSLPIYQEFVRELPAGKQMIRLIFESDPSALPAAAPAVPQSALPAAAPAVQQSALPAAAPAVQQSQYVPLPARRDGPRPATPRQN
jgi:hypothetical protein